MNTLEQQALNQAEKLLAGCTARELRLAAEWLLLGIRHVKPTNQSMQDWVEALARQLGRPL